MDAAAGRVYAVESKAEIEEAAAMVQAN